MKNLALLAAVMIAAAFLAGTTPAAAQTPTTAWVLKVGGDMTTALNDYGFGVVNAGPFSLRQGRPTVLRTPEWVVAVDPQKRTVSYNKWITVLSWQEGRLPTENCTEFSAFWTERCKALSGPTGLFEIGWDQTTSSGGRLQVRLVLDDVVNWVTVRQTVTRAGTPTSAPPRWTPTPQLPYPQYWNNWGNWSRRNWNFR